MRILVTGAGGFVGRALTARLLQSSGSEGLANGRIELALLDRRLSDVPRGLNVQVFEGDLSDRALVDRAVGAGVGCVFHLASVPGGAAEADFELGLHVNLEATIGLLEALRVSGCTPRYVFASTIGVYGVPMPQRIDEDTVAAPSLSYGAHKLIGEILAADSSRRGHIDGVSLRLPGIVARPPQRSGMLSAFLSDMLRELAAGRRFTCPVAATGVSWWMSRACVVENLVHAATIGPERLEERRTFLLPVLRASMAEIVAAVGRVYDVAAADLVSYRDDARLRAQFASYPPLDTPVAREAGFRDDGSVDVLVRRALEE